MQYYTYAYLREDGNPYYIGKGKGRRAYQKHNGFYPPSKNRILILKQNLTEENAFNHEIYMINVFGRKNLGTGILHNKTNGGRGCSKKIMNEMDIYNRKKGRLGKSLSKSHKKRIGESNKGVSRISDERKEELREEIKNKPKMSRKGIFHSGETKMKMSESRKGKDPWNKGLTGVQTPWNKGIKNPNMSSGKNPRSKKICYNDKIYDCIKDAMEITGKSRGYIKKYGILLDN